MFIKAKVNVLKTGITVCVISIVLTCLLLVEGINAQVVSPVASPDEVNYYTQEWEGERYEDGRPKVSDDILEAMKHVTHEEAWLVLKNEGYHNKEAFNDEWKILDPTKPIVGRALTATYVPSSPHLHKRMHKDGGEKGRPGPMNYWPVDMLQNGDVYVSNTFNKVEEGSHIGDRIGTGIMKKSGNGVVFQGNTRDVEGLRQIEGFNAFVTSLHPSYRQEVMLNGLNTPTRIGEAIVLPGDIVLAKEGGVVFIPPFLASKVIAKSEITRLRDTFGNERVMEGKYDVPESYFEPWSDKIKKDFFKWLDNNRERINDELHVSDERIDEIIETEEISKW